MVHTQRTNLKTRNFCPWESNRSPKDRDGIIYDIYQTVDGRMVECRVKMKEYMRLEFVY